MGLGHLMKRRLSISIHIAPRLVEKLSRQRQVSVISVGFVVVRVQETLEGVISQS